MNEIFIWLKCCSCDDDCRIRDLLEELRRSPYSTFPLHMPSAEKYMLYEQEGTAKANSNNDVEGLTGTMAHGAEGQPPIFSISSLASGSIQALAAPISDPALTLPLPLHSASIASQLELVNIRNTNQPQSGMMGQFNLKSQFGLPKPLPVNDIAAPQLTVVDSVPCLKRGLTEVGSTLGDKQTYPKLSCAIIGVISRWRVLGFISITVSTYINNSVKILCSNHRVQISSLYLFFPWPLRSFI